MEELETAVEESEADAGPDIRVSPYEVAVGCRAPDFIVKRADGSPFHFYRELAGQPALLLFWSGAQNPMAVAGLEALASRWDELAEFGLEGIAIAADDTPPFEEEERLPFAFFRDSGDQVGEIYRRASGLVPHSGEFALDSISAFCLDANQRIMGIVSHPAGEVADEIIALYRELHGQHEAARALSGPAPILYLPRLIDAELCDELIRYWDEGRASAGGTEAAGQQGDLGRYYQRKDQRIDRPIEDTQLQADLELAIGRRIAPELEKAFRFANFHFERFLVTRYDASQTDETWPHRDNLAPDTQSRRFAVTVNLNDDYAGGELVFPEYGPHKHRTHKGGAIISSCSLIQEVLPVTEGKRYCLLNFCRYKRPGTAGQARPG